MRFRKIHSVILSCIASAAFAAPAFAQDANAAFSLELNNAVDPGNGSCRLTYVAANQSDIALDRTAYEVAVFDANGVVSRLLVLEFGALIEGKTKILQFDLANSACDGISKIIINNVAACTRTDTKEEDAFCLNGLTASSRTAIQFGI